MFVNWLIHLVEYPSVSTTNCDLQKGYFCVFYWGCTSIFQPLSYPFRSLGSDDLLICETCTEVNAHLKLIFQNYLIILLLLFKLNKHLDNILKYRKISYNKVTVCLSVCTEGSP